MLIIVDENSKFLSGRHTVRILFPTSTLPIWVSEITFSGFRPGSIIHGRLRVIDISYIYQPSCASGDDKAKIANGG